MDLILNDDILTINGKKYKLVPVEERQVQEKERTGWERVEEGEAYYYLDHCIESDYDTDVWSDTDDTLYKAANYFNDEQLCNDVGIALSIYLRILRWQAENDVPVDIHNSDVTKWYIRYHLESKSFYASWTCSWADTFNIYFSTKEKAEECMKIFESDLVWLHTKFSHRLDGKGVDNAEM